MRLSIRLHNLELFRNVKDVLVEIIPINKLEIKAFGTPKDRLLKALTKRQQVINLFIRADKPIIGDIL